MGIKWFQHYSDAFEDPEMKMVYRNWGGGWRGLAAIGFVWLCREEVAKEGKNFRLTAEKDWKVTLAEKSMLDVKEVEELMSFQADKGLIDRKALEKGDLYIPKLKNYADDYTKRVRRVSEDSTDKVPLDKSTLDNITKEYIRIRGLQDISLSRNDMASIYTGAAKLLKRAGDAETAFMAIEWVARQGYIEWNLFTVEKKVHLFLKDKSTIGKVQDARREIDESLKKR